ncbi:MAG: SDR family NAD(P)-dependent oxidoreductase [Firmicutes bacterium]|nr:SDR family NAD(P)-dependent oxidoreductase [Bacillota bacterium]
MRSKDKRIYGDRVFVTGATSGIGRACARAFAASGYQVTGVSRSAEDVTERFPGGGTLTLRPLDVTDEEAVKAFVESLPGVDIAILCAGMGVAGPAEITPAEMTRKQMEVNYFGTLNAAQPCLTRMRRQGKGLLLVIGSIAGRVSIPMQSQYSSSKYALEAFTDAVRMEMRPFGVRASIIEPGDTKTGFTAARITQEIDEAFAAYEEVLKKSIAKMAGDEQNGKDPDSVAKVALALAAKKNPPARVPVGIDYKALMVLLRFLPDRVKEAIISKLYLPE